MRQATRNKTGPISPCSKEGDEDAVRPEGEELGQLGLAEGEGAGRRPSPSPASMSKA